MQNKCCTKCNLLKQVSHFSINKKCKSGYQSWCKDCVAKQTRQYNAERMRIRRLNTEYYAKERNQQLVYRANNQNTVLAAKRINTIKRRISISQATPHWANSEFESLVFSEAYDLAKLRKEVFGFEWHVDHIVPLRGRHVSGFHISTNVQVIPAQVNLQKSNKFCSKGI